MSECATRTEHSYCRICTSMCGIVVEVEGDRVVRVRGDRDHPVTHGYVCPKGTALPKMHHHPKRLERPMIKVGESLQPTSWSHCLDDLGSRLRRIIDQHGPASVGIFFGSGVGMDAAGYRMAQALHAAIGTPARFSPLTIDGTAKTLVASVVGGFPGLSPRPDYEHVNLVIYVGINPMVSHGHTIAMPNPAKTIRATASRGEVWVIDPIHTETARFASHHIAPHPGTDYAILAYLVREVLREGADQEVLSRSTSDCDALRAAVEPFSREHAAELSGLRPDELDSLLASVRKAGRLAVETGTGVTMSVAANLTQWLAWVLMIVTGSMNRKGGVWFHPGFVNRLDGGLPVITEIFGPGPPSRPEMRSIVGDWPCAALVDEIHAGNIRAFLNLGGNMIRSFPDANALQPALQKLDVFATMEIIENETTALSTHILTTKDQLERPDLALWDFLSPRVNAQYTPAIVKPVGDRRSTWWVLAELMRRLGHEPPGAVADDDGTGTAADNTLLAAVTEHARCQFSELVEKRYAETTHELPAPWVEAHIEKLGGWKLAPKALVEQLAAVRGAHAAKRAGQSAASKELTLTPRRQRRHLNAQFLFLGSTPDVLLHPTDAASAGVDNGQQVIVRSSRGEIIATVHVDEGVRPGVISVPHGHEHANVNVLTDMHEVDSLTGMARYSGIQVTVHPIGH